MHGCASGVRDSDHLVGTPFRAGGRMMGPDGGTDCYGLVLAMAVLRGLPLRDEAALRDRWYLDSVAAAHVAGSPTGWLRADGPPRVDDILVLLSDSGAPTHLGWVDDPWHVIQATRHGVVRVELDSVRPVRIYRHGSRLSA